MNSAIFDRKANTIIKTKIMSATILCLEFVRTRSNKIDAAPFIINRKIALARSSKIDSSFNDYIFKI